MKSPLWNMTLKEHSDRDMKNKMWLEVASKLIKNSETLAINDEKI